MSEANRIEFNKLVDFCKSNNQNYEFSGGYQCAINNAWVHIIEGSYYVIYFKPFKKNNKYCLFIDNAFKSFDKADEVIEYLGRV